MCFVVLTLFQVYSVCVQLDVGPDNSASVLHFTELTFCTFGKSKSRNIVTINYIICSFSKLHLLSFFISESCFVFFSFFPPSLHPLMFSLIQVPFGLPLRQIMSHSVYSQSCLFICGQKAHQSSHGRHIHKCLFLSYFNSINDFFKLPAVHRFNQPLRVLFSFIFFGSRTVWFLARKFMWSRLDLASTRAEV